MRPWSSHKFDVLLPKSVESKNSAFSVDRSHKLLCKLGFNSILSCIETNMVVIVATRHPILLLTVIAYVTNNVALV